MRSFYILVFTLFSSISFGQEKIILDESFSTTDLPWTTAKNAGENVAINTGRSLYIIDHKQTGALAVHLPIKLDERRDFKITANLYKDKGVKNYGYGLLWGGKDKNYYTFMITANGFYIIAKMENGTWTDLVPDGWIKTGAVKPGNNKYNVLGLSKISGTYHFEINGAKIATMPIGNFYGDWVGFNVNNKQKILVDWIKVEYL